MKSNYPYYSYLTTYLSLFLSFYSCIILYLSNNIIWIIVSLSLILNYFILRSSKLVIDKIFNSQNISILIKKFLFLFSTICLFLSSFYGLINIIYSLSLHNKINPFILILAFILTNLSVSLNLYEKANK